MIEWQGRPATLNFLRDITERRQAEEALRESEKRYRSTLDNIMEGCQIIGRDWRYLYVNNAVARHGRRAKEDLLGRRMMEVYPGIENTEVFGCLRRCMTERIPHQMENEFLYPDGSTGCFELSIQPVPEGIFVLSIDITDRRQAEEALRENEKRLIEAQRIAKVGDFTWDVETGEVTWSDAMFDMLQYDKSATIDFARVNAEIHHPDDLDQVSRWLNDCLESGNEELAPKEYRVVRRDGSMLFVRTVGRIERAEGKPVRVFATVQDISERKRVEQERERLQVQLTQVQKMESIGRLAGGVAHDLNNLLSPILGYSEMLLIDLGADDERRSFVDEILGAGRRARDLVHQLLAFSRRQTLAVRPVDINETIAGFQNLLRRTIPEDIRIEVVPSPVILPVMADVGQIEQVIMNLAVNAADAMPDGGTMTIETTVVDLDEEYAAEHIDVEPGRHVMLAISDTGSGLDEGSRDRIFEPFYSTKGERGTGLGLATVYGIVKQHGGNIWVYSEPGRGATFKIYLPIADQVHREGKIGKKAASDLTGSETILLVEDNGQVRRLAHAILKRQGYAVLEAKDSREALAALETHTGPVHLLLTDVVMPGMNGRELYNRCVEKHPGLKVLYMSGYTDNVIAHRGVLDEGVNFIQKPFSVQTVAQKVREVLEQR